MKRLFDVALACLLMLILAIPMLCIAVAVKLTSRGPILHWSNRIGRANRIFAMPKFRTMKVGTPQLATHLLVERDRWLTPIGRLLRTTSLDELPQLWSILVGHMSFVGPRPALFNQTDLTALRTEAGVHGIRPGLTGWAQVHGRDELSIPDKVAFDTYYLTHRTFALDAYILLVTLQKVWARENVADSSCRPTQIGEREESTCKQAGRSRNSPRAA